MTIAHLGGPTDGKLRHSRIGRAQGRVQAWDPALHEGVIEPEESMRERLQRDWPDVVYLNDAQVVGEVHCGPVETDRDGQRFMRCWAYVVEKRVPPDVVAQLRPEDFRTAEWITWRE